MLEVARAGRRLRPRAGAVRRRPRGRAPARSSRCSAATAPASRPRSRRSWGWSGRSPARCASTARRIDGLEPLRDRAPRPRLRARGPPHLHRPHRGGEPRGRTPAAARRRARPGAQERLFAAVSRARARCASGAAARMSGGEQQMLCIARTLAGNPSAILLDEPSEGLAPVVVEQVARAIVELKAAPASPCCSPSRAALSRERVADRSYTARKGTASAMAESRPAADPDRAAAGDGGGIQRLVRRRAPGRAAGDPGLPLGAALGGRLPPGEGKYLATYELDSLAVLTSPRVPRPLQNQTPWSQALPGQGVVFKRWACEQVGRRRDPHPAAKAVVVRSTAERSPCRRPCRSGKFAATSGEKITLYELGRRRRPRVPTASTSLERYAWLSVAAALATIGLKTLAWWLTGSVGLLSDALESLVNLAAALLALCDAAPRGARRRTRSIPTASPRRSTSPPASKAR